MSHRHNDDDFDVDVDVGATNNHPIAIINNNNNDASPSFLQAQKEALQRFERQRQRQHANAGHNNEQLCDDESAALAAAIAASAHEEETRIQQQQREQQRKRRLEQQQQQQQEQELLARQSQQQEQDEADQELAQAMEASEHEERARETNQLLDRSLQQVAQKRSRERHVGIWDCLHCTYENPPYAPLCAMCQRQPPIHTLVFQDIPATLCFGLELELIITDGKRDGYTLEWMATQLSSSQMMEGPAPAPLKVVYHGYSHETTNHWKIVTDSSLRGCHHSDLCFELVSPVLRGNHNHNNNKGLVQLRTILERVRQLGIATNKTCGFHVHVDATSTTLPELQRIAQCFVALENGFDLLVAGKNHRSTDQNRYCRSNRMAFGTKSNRQRWDQIASTQTVQEVVDLMNPNHDRYRKLNLVNLTNDARPSTIEFRLHGGVEELQEAEAWVRLLLRFCHRAASTAFTTTTATTTTTTPITTTENSILPMAALNRIQNLREETTPAEELQALWDLIACPGLEQFYVLRRKLFEQKQLQNTWRCRRCRKPFGTSRALSQHLEATGH